MQLSAVLILTSLTAISPKGVIVGAWAHAGLECPKPIEYPQQCTPSSGLNPCGGTVAPCGMGNGLAAPAAINWATAGGQAHVNGYVAVSHLPGSTLVVSIAPSVSGTFTQLASFSAAAAGITSDGQYFHVLVNATSAVASNQALQMKWTTTGGTNYYSCAIVNVVSAAATDACPAPAGTTGTSTSDAATLAVGSQALLLTALALFL